jgi:hypothetical protein
MDYKSIVTIIFVTFVLLLIFYRSFGNDNFVENYKHCQDNEVCVNFCCFDSECEDKNHFKIHHLDEAKNLTKEFKILKNFTCDPLDNEGETWRFLKVK